MADEQNDLEERIRHRAYLLWEMEGRQEGGAKEYWERARQLIESEGESSYPPSQAQGTRF